MMCKLLFGILVVPLLLSVTSSFRIKAKKRSRVVVDGAVRSISGNLNKESSLIAYGKGEVFNSAGGSSKAHSTRAHEINSTGDLSLVALARKQEKAFSSVASRTITQPEVKSDAPLKFLRRATAEEIDEILSIAIEKAKQSEKISGLEEKFTEANVDSKQTAPPQVPRNMLIFHSIVSPILSAKGFQDVSIGEFLLEMHSLVEMNYDCFLEHAFELDSMLALKLGSAIRRKLTPLAESAAEPDQCPKRRSAREAELKPFGEATPEQVDEVLIMATKSAKKPDNLSLLGKAAGSIAFALIVSPILTAKGFQEVSLQGFVARVAQVAELFGRDLEHLIELDGILQPQEDVPSVEQNVLAAIFGSTAYWTACIVVAALAFILIILLCFMGLGK